MTPFALCAHVCFGDIVRTKSYTFSLNEQSLRRRGVGDLVETQPGHRSGPVRETQKARRNAGDGAA